MIGDRKPKGIRWAFNGDGQFLKDRIKAVDKRYFRIKIRRRIKSDARRNYLNGKCYHGLDPDRGDTTGSGGGIDAGTEEGIYRPNNGGSGGNTGMEMKKKEIIASIGGILTIVAIFFAGYFFLRSEFAPMAVAEDLKQFKQTYDYDKAVNFLKQTEGRIYVLKERHGEKPANQTIKEELNRLEQDAKELKSKINTMEKK